MCIFARETWESFFKGNHVLSVKHCSVRSPMINDCTVGLFLEASEFYYILNIHIFAARLKCNSSLEPLFIWLCHSDGRRKDEHGALAQLEFEILHHPIIFSAKNGCFLSFEKVKLYFTAFAPHGKIFVCTSGKIHSRPPRKNFPTPMVIGCQYHADKT